MQPAEPAHIRPRAQMKEAQRVQENKELAADFTAKQEVEAAEHAKAQAEAGALAASELEKVLQAEADTDGDGDGWGWGADASPTKSEPPEESAAVARRRCLPPCCPPLRDSAHTTAPLLSQRPTVRMPAPPRRTQRPAWSRR